MPPVQNVKIPGYTKFSDKGENAATQNSLPFGMLELIPSPTAYLSKSNRYEYVNKAYADWYGTTAENIVGKTAVEFLGPQIYEDLRDQMQKVLEGTQVNYQTEIPFKEGYRFIDATYSPDFDMEGRVRGYLALVTDITDHRDSQKKIEQSETNYRQSLQALNDGERKYRQLIESLPLAIYSCDKEGHITFFNDVAVKLWGHTPDIHDDALKFCACYKVTLPDGTFVSPENTPMAIALQTGQTFRNVEAWVERPNGEKFYASVNIELLFDDRKNVVGAINIFQDITKRKKIESALLESEKRYRNLIHSLPAAIYTTDKDGYITMYNEAAAEFWGRQPELGKDMWCGSWKIYEPDGIREVPLDQCPMAIALKEKRKVTSNDPYIVEQPGGKRRYFIPYPEPIYDAEGTMTGAFNMLIDVTENQLSERDKARLAAVVQSSDDAIISKTLDGIVTSWNDSAQRVFGYTEQEMIGQSITVLIPPDRLDEEPQIILKLRQGERVEHFETKRVAKDGKLLDISLTISPIKDSKGRIIGASKIARDITEQKLAERLMHESEERFRMAVQTTNLGTWEYSPHNFKLFCSSESRRMCGLPDDIDPDFETVFNHVYEEDKNYFIEQIKNAIDPAGNGDFDMKIRINRYSDRELRWIHAQGKMFFDSEIFPQRLIGTMLDITEEKNRELELTQSVELFQTMADNVPAMIWMSGTDKYDDYFNKTWLEFTGRTLEQERDEGWLEGVHPDDVQKCIGTYNASFNTQNGFYTEYRLRRSDGKYRWISDNSVPRFSSDGEFLGFISACIDIDDQKRFREKIQASELLFKTISNASPAALWMTNENEENVFVSDTWLKWTGKTFGEVIDRGWIHSVLEEDKEVTMTRFRECFKDRKYFNAEFRFVKADGEVRWGLTEGYPFHDFSGEFSGFAGSVTDITEIKKLEQRKDDFIKMASHELKTPITSINGYVQLLMNIYNEADEQKLHLSKPTVKSSLSTISKQVAKLTRLISELLDLSKIESGKLELHKTEFNLADLINEAVQDVRQTASKHAIIVHSDFEGKIFGDKDRIGQVLLNLLTNAIKYSPNADSVELYLEGNKEAAIIKVRDFGIGIDKKDHLKIFERFYRVEGKSEQTFPGFGIGLFIATEIVHRHSGTVRVESEKGKGSIFTITIPVNTKNRKD